VVVPQVSWRFLAAASGVAALVVGLCWLPEEMEDMGRRWPLIPQRQAGWRRTCTGIRSSLALQVHPSSGSEIELPTLDRDAGREQGPSRPRGLRASRGAS
jgi:hypothetical protein